MSNKTNTLSDASQEAIDRFLKASTESHRLEIMEEFKNAPDKELINLAATWRYQQWRVNAAVDNLMNRFFLDFSRKPLPGRILTLTIEYQLGDSK